jgi:hypothetical protein
MPGNLPHGISSRAHDGVPRSSPVGRRQVRCRTQILRIHDPPGLTTGFPLQSTHPAVGGHQGPTQSRGVTPAHHPVVGCWSPNSGRLSGTRVPANRRTVRRTSPVPSLGPKAEPDSPRRRVRSPSNRRRWAARRTTTTYHNAETHASEYGGPGEIHVLLVELKGPAPGKQ